MGTIHGMRFSVAWIGVALVLGTGCGGASFDGLGGEGPDAGAGGAEADASPARPGSRPGSLADGSAGPEGADGATVPPEAGKGPPGDAGGAGRPDTGPPACIPETCQPAEQCGAKVDACGNHYDCGTCTAPEVCGSDHRCTCTPKTCAALLRPCGQMDDGCGHLVDCPGTCAPRDTCGGAGTPNECGNFTNACAQTKTPAQPACVGVSNSTTFHVFCADTQIDLRWCMPNQSVGACPGGVGWMCSFPI